MGLLTCVTGVSGSGKSTLINGTSPLAATVLNGATTLRAAHEGCEGLEHFDKCIDIDQSPIGRNLINPATYTGIFTPVRFSRGRRSSVAVQTRSVQLQCTWRPL